MIFLTIACIVVGGIIGILLYKLIREDIGEEYSLSKKKEYFLYTISGLFMGCAFLCASLYLKTECCIEAIVVLGGLIFLASFAIQDMLQLAVYAFLLNVGVAGMFVLRSLVFIFEGEFFYLFSFLIISGILYVGMKIVARYVPELIGCGDYDILFLIILLCGMNGFIQVIFISSLIGLIIYVPKLAFKRMKKEDKIPLAPILYLGTLAYFLL